MIVFVYGIFIFIFYHLKKYNVTKLQKIDVMMWQNFIECITRIGFSGDPRRIQNQFKNIYSNNIVEKWKVYVLEKVNNSIFFL